MCQLGRKLQQKLEYIESSDSISKEEIMDIIYMAIEEEGSLEQSILDYYIPEIDDTIDLEDIIDQNDYKYDSWEDDQITNGMED